MLRVNKTARVSDSAGFKKMFAPGRLTLGVFFPIEAFERDEPTMHHQEHLARRAEELGFAALGVFKPFAQSLYIDLIDEPDAPPQPIHLGFRGGRNVVFRFLAALRTVGLRHVILNFKYCSRDAAEALEEMGQEILPQLEAS